MKTARSARLWLVQIELQQCHIGLDDPNLFQQSIEKLFQWRQPHQRGFGWSRLSSSNVILGLMIQTFFNKAFLSHFNEGNYFVLFYLCMCSFLFSRMQNKHNPVHLNIKQTGWYANMIQFLKKYMQQIAHTDLSSQYIGLVVPVTGNQSLEAYIPVTLRTTSRLTYMVIMIASKKTYSSQQTYQLPTSKWTHWFKTL